MRRSCPSETSCLWLCLALGVVAGTSPVHRVPLRPTAATPGALSTSRRRSARYWQTSATGATAVKVRRPREDCCSTAARGCSKAAIPALLFVPGDPDQSLLIKAVRYKDEDLRMPPDGKKLTGAQVADLEAWVKMGAPLPGRASAKPGSRRVRAPIGPFNR